MRVEGPAPLIHAEGATDRVVVASPQSLDVAAIAAAQEHRGRNGLQLLDAGAARAMTREGAALGPNAATLRTGLNPSSFTREDWKLEYRILRERVRDIAEAVRSLAVSEHHIVAVHGRVGGSGNSGAESNGVFVVETEAGPAALKLNHRPFDARVTISRRCENLQRDEIAFQNQLAEYGLAFPITAVLDEASTAALLRKHPHIMGMTSHTQDPFHHLAPKTGLLMRYVPDGYNPKVNGQTFNVADPPVHAKNWDLEAIKARLLRLATARDNLELPQMDGQLLYTADGVPYAFDLSLDPLVFADDLRGERFQSRGEQTWNRNTLMSLFELMKAKIQALS